MSTKRKRGTANGSVSIQDVAREAGVAASTVSRALTVPGRIAEKTRVKVLEAANRLGYTANAAARKLRKGQSRVVLVVLPGPFNAGASQVIGEIITVIDKEFAARDYSLVIANVDRQADSDRYMLDLAFSGQVDGAIIISSGVPESGGRSLADSGIPIVSTLFDCSAEGIPSVVTNDRQVSREVVIDLLDRGHRSFLYLGGPRGNYVETERYKGVRLALRGRKDCTLTALNGDFHFESGTLAAQSWLDEPDRPTAVFCASDDMAIAFIRRVTEVGIKVPADVSVVGFDGSRVGAFTVPSLSSVGQPTALIGRDTVRAIIAQMQKPGSVPLITVVPSTLILRESVGVPRAAKSWRSFVATQPTTDSR
jgi:LacI family repressor for deo operon, udp, cdd, tsx, nupC, and nupG